MKRINLQDENSKERHIFVTLVQKHKNDLDTNDFRNMILDAVSMYGAEGINVLKEGFIAAEIDLDDFENAVAKIIRELQGIEN